MATSILEESWPEKFLQGAINLQGSSSSAEVGPYDQTFFACAYSSEVFLLVCDAIALVQTFFRERGDPEATTISR